jgi:hypothetical protein
MKISAPPFTTPETTKVATAQVEPMNVIVDVLLIVLLTACAFGLAFHPYFFGDELIAYELAAHNDSFFAIFHELNTNKPRLVFNGIEALLAKLQVTRMTHVVLVATCMAWINVLILSVARYQFNASRLLAWLLILGVLSSRYGVMLYFDYQSGLIETLSSALLLSTMLLAWLAYRHKFNAWYAAGALATAIITGFVHERYMVGALAIGGVITLTEHLGKAAMRRKTVVGWALSLGLVPLLLYWFAIKVVGALPITTVGGAQRVSLGIDTVWTALTYSYNVLLGGNYGPEWFWGHYAYSHPAGKFMGWVTAFCTSLMIAVIVVRKGIAEHGRWLVLGFGTVVIAFIAIASLAGTVRQEARFMFPAGIVVLITWFLILKNPWRYVAIASILATNMMYFLLNSHDSMMYIYSSRAANSLASSLLAVHSSGMHGIVVGNRDDLWTIGGGSQWGRGHRKGELFSTINLGSAVHIDPFVEGETIDQDFYDFGLVFDGFGPHRTATYRRVSIDTALRMVGALDLDNIPVKLSLGSKDSWANWQWRSPPEFVDGALKLAAGVEGWLAVPAQDLNEAWLVFQARAQDKLETPMRLQVNWHAKDNRFLSTTIRVVYPTEILNSYSTMLIAPAEAEIGYVYATLHGDVNGIVEVQEVTIK